jgi:hypothetical protein
MYVVVRVERAVDELCQTLFLAFNLLSAFLDSCIKPANLSQHEVSLQRITGSLCLHGRITSVEALLAEVVCAR